MVRSLVIGKTGLCVIDAICHSDDLERIQNVIRFDVAVAIIIIIIVNLFIVI